MEKNGMGSTVMSDTVEPVECCPICLSSESRTVLIPCFHSFCFSCIEKWLVTNPVCPLCKQEAKLVSNNSEIVKVKDLKKRPSKWGKGPMFGLELRKYMYRNNKKSIISKKETMVKPDLKDWISRDLEVLGIPSDLLSNYIYTFFIQNKSNPNIEKELNALLRDYLMENTELFVGEMIRFSCSKLEIKTFDSYIKHE